MRWVSLTLALTGLVIGLMLVWAGQWLLWDWANSVIRPSVPWIDWDTFCREWIFYAPLFLYRWNCQTWTGPFDLSKLWLDLGLFLAVVSAFALGYYARPGIEKILRKLKG